MVQPVYKRVHCSRGQTAINTDPVKQLVSRGAPAGFSAYWAYSYGLYATKMGKYYYLEWIWTGMGFLFYQL